MKDFRSAERQLEALRQRFALSLPGRLDAIEAALETSRTEAERLFHSLAGTAGTYGYTAIGLLAARGEEICENGGAPREILAELRAACGTVAPTPFPNFEPESKQSSTLARILCVEDDPDQAAYLCAVLNEAGYETAVAHDAAEFAQRVEAFRPDLLMLDLSLPDGNGIDLAAAVRRDDAHAALPIVFVTARSSQRSRLDGIRAGGDDYLVKPVARDVLLATVAARLERSRSVRTLIERDPLTQAVTRSAFLRGMEAVVRDHRESGMPYCLVMLDVDHFKNINDRYGHLIGDRVLSLFGRFLRTNVRTEDVVGRCGGEEFGILLAGMAQDDACNLIERLLDRFGRIPHAARGGERFYVTFSAGVAGLEEDDDADSWRQRADDRAYAAKRAGRARVAAA